MMMLMMLMMLMMFKTESKILFTAEENGMPITKNFLVSRSALVFRIALLLGDTIDRQISR